MSDAIAKGRVKSFAVSDELFLELFKDGKHPGYKVIADAIPDDASLVSVRRSFGHAIEYLIHSKEFDELKLGDEIPIMTITIESL